MTRRHFLLGTTACMLLAACRSAPPPPPKPVTPEQARYLESRERMLKKFGRPGFELVVDAMAGQEFLGVEFFPEDAKYPFYQRGGNVCKRRARERSRSLCPNGYVLCGGIPANSYPTVEHSTRATSSAMN